MTSTRQTHRRIYSFSVEKNYISEEKRVLQPCTRLLPCATCFRFLGPLVCGRFGSEVSCGSSMASAASWTSLRGGKPC